MVQGRNKGGMAQRPSWQESCDQLPLLTVHSPCSVPPPSNSHARPLRPADPPDKNFSAEQIPLHYAGLVLHPHGHERSILRQPSKRAAWCWTCGNGKAAAAAAATATALPPASLRLPPLLVLPGRAAAPAVAVAPAAAALASLHRPAAVSTLCLRFAAAPFGCCRGGSKRLLSCLCHGLVAQQLLHLPLLAVHSQVAAIHLQQSATKRR